MPVSLNELLASRDARFNEQHRLLNLFSNKALVCLTVIMPGAVKRNDITLSIAQYATQAIENQFNGKILECIKKDLNTGYEAFYIVDMEPIEAKKIACQIEEEHPLGRLFDVDVITKERPLSRSEIGVPERRCLLCDNPARYCMRAKKHSTEEIIEQIKKIFFNYVRI